MPLELFLIPLLFAVVIIGLAWPLADRLGLDPAEKLCATAVLSLLGSYGLAFAIYLLNLPRDVFWTLPVLATMGLITGRRALTALWGDPVARALLGGGLLVAAWGIGWLSLVVSYSGGGWGGDWLEHWWRTRFFLEHGALDTKFLTLYPLTVRPPLANLVTGALLSLTGVNFAGYQLVTTLLNCLVFVPAALLARRFQSRLCPGPPVGQGPAVIAVLTVLLMLNPSFVENATFAWTKLIAGFFILTGLYFFLRAHDPAPPPAAAPLCAASLAAGILTHYSAAPYAGWLALAWLALGRPREPAFWRRTVGLALLGGLILSTWFGWAGATYGPGTLLANPSLAINAPPSGSPLVVFARNLRDTLVPHFFRRVDPLLIEQASPWGYARDWFFQLYQLNLFFVFGSVGWLVLGRALFRGARQVSSPVRWFWILFVASMTILGVAVVAARDHWGLAHICLQPLVGLGLACLAAQWPGLSRGWRRLAVAGATLDLALGIVLHFGVQNYAFDRWFSPPRSLAEVVQSYSSSMGIQMQAKMVLQLNFMHDVAALPSALVLALLAGILTLAVVRAARRPS